MTIKAAVALAFATLTLGFAAAVLFDIVLFGNYAAVPFHSAAGLLAALMAIAAWALGKRAE